MTNRRIAEIFSGVADILELKGENPFRVRAYQKAARTVEGQSKDVAAMSREEILRLPGIGADLASKIEEIARTGGLKAYDDLRGEVPEGLTEIMSVPGLGPKTAKMLYEKLKVTSLDKLEELAREGKLAGLPGVKEKTEDNILKGIEMSRRHRERQPLGVLLPLAREIIGHLREKAPVQRLSVAGSLRRWKDTIKDIDILCTSASPEKAMGAFTGMPDVRDVLMRGPTRSSVVLGDGTHVDLRVVEEDSYGSALCYFTGSKAHNIRLRELAVKKGLKINEYGIFKGKKKIGGAREEDIYETLGLEFVPPELREDTGEVEAAREGRLPRLVKLADIRGDIHVHSSQSDGKHTLPELVEAARARGYSYIALTDHSKGLGIARGLDEKRILAEVREIDALNKRLRGFRVLKGVEVDIRSDLALDFDDDILGKLDVVVASIHSGFKQSREKLTGRLEAAMRNPHVHVIAHPTGRLIGERDAYDVDMDQVIRVAKETGTALEINAYPMRLDLNDANARAAAERSVPIVINTDTHLLGQFDFMEYGVFTARRGWLEKKDVANASDWKTLLKRLKGRG